MSRPATVSRKNHRRHVSIPGVLQGVLHRRYLEFRYPSFPPYALEAVCFDLRLRREHELTLVFARANAEAQDALDQLIARHYLPGEKARGLLLRVIDGEAIPSVPPLPRGEYARWKEYVHYSEALAPCIETRWQEAGYGGFSAYLTALIRYDLLLLGPHKHYNGDDWGAARMAELDAKTVEAFHDKQQKSLYIDHLLNRSAGWKLTAAEWWKLARKLRVGGVDADRLGLEFGSFVESHAANGPWRLLLPHAVTQSATGRPFSQTGG